MDVRGQENEKSILTNLQGEKMETSKVTPRNSDNSCVSDVVKGDSSEGVKVSDADCGTGGGESVKSDSGDAVLTEGVKDAEKEGEGAGVAKSEEEKKLWAAVQANPADFTSWTALLQKVEQKVRMWSLEVVCKMTSVPQFPSTQRCTCTYPACVCSFSSIQSVLDPACEVFSQFLGLYPYCYGYWKKYADLVKRLCTDERARDVLEEGVAAIPLSVDLWLHYANFTVTSQSDSPQAEELIRRSKLILTFCVVPPPAPSL